MKAPVDAGAALYRPSCGTEGADFGLDWCARCRRDVHAERGDGCSILGDTYAYEADDPRYPREWREDGPEGPRCTAFDPIDPAVQPRCPLTMELFA